MKRSTLFFGFTAAATAVVILLIIVSIVISLQKKPEEKSTPVPAPAPAPAKKEEEPPVEKERCPSVTEQPATGCPSNPYTYCSSDNISKVYIVSGCAPSANLIKKLTAEGKITGEDDPKVIKCCKNPELCTAAGIRSYPSIICANAPTSVYEGYCP